MPQSGLAGSGDPTSTYMKRIKGVDRGQAERVAGQRGPYRQTEQVEARLQSRGEEAANGAWGAGKNWAGRVAGQPGPDRQIEGA